MLLRDLSLLALLLCLSLFFGFLFSLLLRFYSIISFGARAAAAAAAFTSAFELR